MIYYAIISSRDNVKGILGILIAKLKKIIKNVIPHP